MPVVLDDALLILLTAATKVAIQEVTFWAQNKTRDEILARAEAEEQKTEDLFKQMDGG